MRSVPRAVWSLEENTEHLLVFAWNLRCKHPLQPGGGRAFYLVLASLIAANTSLVLFQYRNTCTSRMVFHTAPSTNDRATCRSSTSSRLVNTRASEPAKPIPNVISANCPVWPLRKFSMI